MKTLLPSIIRLLPVIFLAIMACKEPVETVGPEIETPGDLSGTPTEAGKPVGAQVTKTIGPAGGSIALPGNNVVFTFPAGALAKDVAITVQPVENKVFTPAGLAYEVTPKNIKLEKNAEITWKYTQEEIDGSAPEALGIAYQDEKGVWQSKNNVKVNKEAQTATAAVTHLAHWSFYEQFTLYVDDWELAPYAQTELTVKYYEGERDNELLAPLWGPKIMSADRIVKWRLNGNDAGSDQDGNQNIVGQLTEDKVWAKAKYGAPPREPDMNPVMVSAQVDLKQFDHVILLRQIHISSPAYLKIDDQYDDNPMVGLTFNANTLSGVINDATGTKLLLTFYIENFNGKGKYVVNKESSISILPMVAEKVPYLHGYYDKNAKWISGGGTITITEFNGKGKPIAGTVSGTFFEPFLSGDIQSRTAAAKFRGKAAN